MDLMMVASRNVDEDAFGGGELSLPCAMLIKGHSASVFARPFPKHLIILPLFRICPIA
jgi:hypothetical protein